MDTVWIRLTTIPKTPELTSNKEIFMFGPTGIVRFSPAPNGVTSLYKDGDVHVVDVAEHIEFIMDVLCKVRKTQNVLDTKKSRRSKSGKKNGKA